MQFCPDDITAYAEPVLRFCMKRLYDRHDAEDLAGEILAHALAGIQRSDIRSLEAWIFRVARNRYARFIAARNDLREVPLSDLPFDPETDCGVEEALVARERYAEVFRALHSLSASYRDILVDRYIRELPLQEIANTRGLTESCVKWRLSVGRDKMKNRMGDYEMEKVYSRIHMNTGSCNGSMDPGEYLDRQIARAICLAAYEHPLSIEDISLCTGIPSMYIEDELPHLLYGDAVVRDGGKYAANFIILRLSDSRRMERNFAPLVADVAAYFEKAFTNRVEDARKIGFYGCDFGMRRLGYIALPAALRTLIQRVTQADERLQVGPYPPRQDGGYGWYIVSETEDEQEQISPFDSGSNQHLHKTGVMNYYWLGRYHNRELYRSGNQWMYDRELPSKLQNGILPDGLIGDEDHARHVRLNLLEKTHPRKTPR